MLSWHRIWLLNGFNLIRAKPTLTRKQKGAYKSSWSRRGNQKSFTLTIPSNLTKFVQIHFGIIVRQHLTVQKQMGLLRKRYAGLRKGLLLHCCNQVWMEKWWADSMECYLLWSDGKTLHERRFGEPFYGLTIPFGSMVEYHSFSAKDVSRLHQFGTKFLQGVFFGYVLCAG